MYKELDKIGINFSSENIEKFEYFCHFFLKYNEKVNLISNNDAKYLYEKHIFDSLAFNLFYKKYCGNTKIKILDIGTGGGFPSIPISMYYKNADIYAIDSINKKINFIKEFAKELNIKNIHPICARVEDLDDNMRESFDIVVTRAMAKLNMLVEYAIPYLKVGGYLVAYKSLKAEEEIEEAKNALKVLNSEIIEKIEYSLPLKDENVRNLVIIKKKSSVSKQYPRLNGLVKKKSL